MLRSVAGNPQRNRLDVGVTAARSAAVVDMCIFFRNLCQRKRLSAVSSAIGIRESSSSLGKVVK
jgi:hypothetical protein